MPPLGNRKRKEQAVVRRLRGGLLRVGLIALALFVLLMPVKVHAETIKMTSGAVGIWARPLDPSVFLDPYDPAINEKLATILMFAAFQTTAPLNGTVFEAAVEEIATDTFGVPAADFRVEAPEIMTGSAAYLAMLDNGLIYLIFAYQDDLIYMMIAMEFNGVTDDIAALNSIATRALDLSTTPTSPALMESGIAGFAADFDGKIERPMSVLPGREDIPETYQLIDKEFLVLRPN